MQKYLIERALPDIGAANADKLREAAQCSNSVLAELGTDIQWVESYVTPNATVCVYLAANEGLVHEHARRSGFPATRILQVRGMIDPTTACEPTAARI